LTANEVVLQSVMEYLLWNLVEGEGGGAAGGDVMRGGRGAAPLLPPTGGGDGALHRTAINITLHYSRLPRTSPYTYSLPGVCWAGGAEGQGWWSPATRGPVHPHMVYLVYVGLVVQKAGAGGVQ
jgi:hypothetical protein